MESSHQAQLSNVLPLTGLPLSEFSQQYDGFIYERVFQMPCESREGSFSPTPTPSSLHISPLGQGGIQPALWLGNTCASLTSWLKWRLSRDAFSLPSFWVWDTCWPLLFTVPKITKIIFDCVFEVCPLNRDCLLIHLAHGKGGPPSLEHSSSSLAQNFTVPTNSPALSIYEETKLQLQVGKRKAITLNTVV